MTDDNTWMFPEGGHKLWSSEVIYDLRGRCDYFSSRKDGNSSNDGVFLSDHLSSQF